mmetsp:Transcript_109414/g.223608  ORF Transcript_109414/g.223608 Transcript_109414/m.223608 type:complete len:85 (+) Transcript_109414:335-589(+)
MLAMAIWKRKAGKVCKHPETTRSTQSLFFVQSYSTEVEILFNSLRTSAVQATFFDDEKFYYCVHREQFVAKRQNVYNIIFILSE